MSLKRAFKTLHLALDGPFIFCSTIHHYKRDHLHMVAKSLSHQHSPDRGTGSGTVSLGTPAPCGSRKPEELGCLGTAHVKPIYPSQADRKVMNISYCRHEAAKRSRWVSVVFVRQIKENELAMQKKEKIVLLRRRKAHCT